MNEDNNKRAESQAKAQLESIKEMVESLGQAIHTDEYDLIDECQQTIQGDPLSVEVRSDWHSPGAESEYGEFRILLCTGGPAVQIVGDLDKYAQPETATLQYQDWFTRWEKYNTTSTEEELLVEYARQFYFGE